MMVSRGEIWLANLNPNKKIEELLVCEDKISKLKEIVPEFDHRLN